MDKLQQLFNFATDNILNADKTFLYYGQIQDSLYVLNKMYYMVQK